MNTALAKVIANIVNEKLKEFKLQLAKEVGEAYIERICENGEDREPFMDVFKEIFDSKFDQLQEKVFSQKISVDKNGKKRKDPNSPTKPHTAYNLFCKEMREKIKAKDPSITFGDINKICGQKWKELEDKTKYTALAEKDKKRYEEEEEQYKRGEYVRATTTVSKPKCTRTKANGTPCTKSCMADKDVCAIHHRQEQRKSDSDSAKEEKEDKQCVSHTAKGSRCSRIARFGNYCKVHSNIEDKNREHLEHLEKLSERSSKYTEKDAEEEDTIENDEDTIENEEVIEEVTPPPTPKKSTPPSTQKRTATRKR